jgi:short-subunit dehydrogenase
VLKDIETALVTGASGGIGEAFARQLAMLDKDLVLVARSRDKLQDLAGELATRHGVAVHVIAADLSCPDAARPIFQETERLGLQVDLLINNAGFGKGGEFTELPLGVQAGMVYLNVNTVMELARLYLPAMRQRRRGGIINLGSTASFQPVPGMAAYGATKAFVLSLSEALAWEVRGDGVTVMALCPGATATGFQATAGVWEENRGTMPGPDEVVAQALRAFEKRRRYFVHGALNKLTAVVASIAPHRFVLPIAGNVVSDHRQKGRG